MALPTTMRGWTYATTSPSGLLPNLTLSSALPLPTLSPSSSSLLIQTLSAAINPADYKIPEIPLGPLRRFILPVPATPGMDFCGRVVQVGGGGGGGERGFKAGDIVFGRLDPSKYGTLAEYFIAPAEGCAKVPGGLFAGEEVEGKVKGKITADEAACLGVAGLTAYQAIKPYVQEGKGEKVFINGGGGGVGTMAIQIAKALGCYVVVSCSGAKEELCKRLGADEVIDYMKGGLVEKLKGMGKVFKLVVDNAIAPKELYVAANEFLMDGGRYVQVGGGFNREILQTTVGRAVCPRILGGGKHAFEVFMLKNKREDSERLMRWVVEGRLEVVIEEVFELEKVKEAFQKLKGGRCYGKLVVRVGKV